MPIRFFLFCCRLRAKKPGRGAPALISYRRDLPAESPVVSCPLPGPACVAPAMAAVAVVPPGAAAAPAEAALIPEPPRVVVVPPIAVIVEPKRDVPTPAVVISSIVPMRVPVAAVVIVARTPARMTGRVAPSVTVSPSIAITPVVVSAPAAVGRGAGSATRAGRVLPVRSGAAAGARWIVVTVAPAAALFASVATSRLIGADFYASTRTAARRTGAGVQIRWCVLRCGRLESQEKAGKCDGCRRRGSRLHGEPSVQVVPSLFCAYRAEWSMNGVFTLPDPCSCH